MIQNGKIRQIKKRLEGSNRESKEDFKMQFSLEN